MARDAVVSEPVSSRNSRNYGNKSYDIYVHPRCRHAIAELTHYSWKTDKLTGAILPKLADDNNHVIDAMRYALEGVRRAGTGRTEYRSAGSRVTLAATSAGDDTLIPGLKPYQNRSRGWGSVPGVFSNFDY